MKKLLASVLAFGLLLAGCGTGSDDGSFQPKELSEAKIGTIQLMQHVALDQSYEGFKDVLIENGVKEENINYQVAGDQANCSTVADTLVNGGNDLIYAIATPALQAAASKTTSLPIVGSAVTDYESTGLVASNDAPGGNVTGASDLTPVEQQLTLLTQLLPDADDVAILYCGSEDNSIFQGNIAMDVCKELGLNGKVYTVADSNDIQAVVSKVCNDGNDAIYIPTDNLLATYMSSVEAVSSQFKVPCIVGEVGMCENGGFATYGLDYYNLGRLAGEQAIAILKGEKTAADTPIAYLDAADCELAINLKVAEACGITIDKDAWPEAKFIE